ncbi:hypothetical protein [Chitinilyticum litopenaei]|uniref:hypothetical protein n=1 Tax=Chitinilyticum litopenaei TaxID=1121276 RepID=UPI000424E9BE|nr:hypothetical protein [Chitinilyticum litopenaei]
MTEAAVVTDQSVSFLQRYRIHLLGALAVIVLLVALMGGIALGMAKRSFEHKHFLEQIDKLKTALGESLEKRDELNKEVSELTQQLRARKEHIDELEVKLEVLESAQRKAQLRSELGAPAPAPEGAGASVAPAAGKPLPKLSGDCTIRAGAAGSSLQDCIRPGEQPAKPQAAPGAAPAKQGAAH